MSNPRDLVHFLIPQTDTPRVKQDLDDFVLTWSKLSSYIQAGHEEVELALRMPDCSARLVALHRRNEERADDMRVLGEYLDAGAADGWSFRWLHLTDEFNVRTAYRRVMVDKEAVVFCLDRVVADRYVRPSHHDVLLFRI